MNEDEYQYWKQKGIEQNIKVTATILIAIFISLSCLWIWNHPESLQKTSHTEIFPNSGKVFQYRQTLNTTARFTVISARGGNENCVVKLETWNGGLPTIEIYVRANEQAETNLVPLGEYRVKIACGEQWIGRNEMFGRGTRVSVGVSPLLFSQSVNEIRGNTLTLTNRIDGNFRTNNSIFNDF